jgi:hypothetical protein
MLYQRLNVRVVFPLLPTTLLIADIRVTNASLALIPNAPGMRALLFWHGFHFTDLPLPLLAYRAFVLCLRPFASPRGI